MNILVTGANGFIGRRLSPRLMAQGHQVTNFSQDISKPFLLKTSFDLAIHLAAYNITNVGLTDTDLYTAVNVDGTRNLLQAVQARKFIYLSTTKVYKNESRPLTEESPLEPHGAYAQSKLKAEEICRSFLKKESLFILRSVNVLGWGQAAKAVLPVFFQKAKANQALDILQSAHTPMQFVYVEDLIDAIEAVIGNWETSGIFNIAHEEPVTLEQLASAVIALTQSSSVLNITKNSSEVIFSPVICDKAYRSIGWKAKTTLSQILEFYNEAYARTL
jgi:nucleoside-diphosphate-sugar epimerase